MIPLPQIMASICLQNFYFNCHKSWRCTGRKFIEKSSCDTMIKYVVFVPAPVSGTEFLSDKNNKGVFVFLTKACQ